MRSSGATVRAMAGFGVPHEGIATLLDIDPKTLRKYFRRELDRGSVEATAKVAQSLFTMATQDKNVAAAIFWMKARAGWAREARGDGLSQAARAVERDEELLQVLEAVQDTAALEGTGRGGG